MIFSSLQVLGLKSLTRKAAEVLQRSLKDLQAKSEEAPAAPAPRDMRCKTCGCGRFCGICGAQVWQVSPQVVMEEQPVFPVMQMAQPFMMMTPESG